MLLYCDKCGNEHGHPITEEKEKGECGLCKRYLGSMNVMDNEKHNDIVNNISNNVLNIEGVQVKQVEGFVPGTKVDKIEPGSPHKILKQDRVLFFGKSSLTVAIPSTGKRVRISF